MVRIRERDGTRVSTTSTAGYSWKATVNQITLTSRLAANSRTVLEEKLWPDNLNRCDGHHEMKCGKPGALFFSSSPMPMPGRERRRGRITEVNQLQLPALHSALPANASMLQLKHDCSLVHEQNFRSRTFALSREHLSDVGEIDKKVSDHDTENSY